jgi:hypothetical protein
MTETQYQTYLIKKIEDLFPGCVVFKNDPSYKQGILDLTILFEDRWALLEVKASAKAARQPNQEYYVRQLHDMSFASFIYPENETEVLHALQQAFESPRRARVS